MIWNVWYPRENWHEKSSSLIRYFSLLGSDWLKNEGVHISRFMSHREPFSSTVIRETRSSTDAIRPSRFRRLLSRRNGPEDPWTQGRRRDCIDLNQASSWEGISHTGKYSWRILISYACRNHWRHVKEVYSSLGWGQWGSEGACSSSAFSAAYSRASFEACTLSAGAFSLAYPGELKRYRDPRFDIWWS